MYDPLDPNTAIFPNNHAVEVSLGESELLYDDDGVEYHFPCCDCGGQHGCNVCPNNDEDDQVQGMTMAEMDLRAQEQLADRDQLINDRIRSMNMTGPYPIPGFDHAENIKFEKGDSPSSSCKEDRHVNCEDSREYGNHGCTCLCHADHKYFIFDIPLFAAVEAFTEDDARSISRSPDMLRSKRYGTPIVVDVLFRIPR